MRFFLLFLFFWSLSSAAFAENIPSTRPINEAAVIDKAKNSNDLVYQQIFRMQSQLARLDERLEVQKSLGNDVKLLENAQQELKTQLASLQTKLETQEKLQTNQLNGFDERISDIASNTNMWGMAFTIFGLIITVAAIALGFSAKNRAVYEAKQTANTTSKSHMEQWLLDNKDKLIAETKTELKNVSLQLKDRAEKLEVEARDALEKIKQEQQLAWDALLAENKDVVTSKRNKEDNTTTKHNKPKVYQTAQEWFKAGLKAFSSGEYDEALNAWNKVLGLVDSEQESKLYAITMINQGVTYGRLGKPDDELNSYATLIEQFKDSSNEEIQTQVATAMCNQGLTYEGLGRYDDELNSYATLIEQYKDSPNEEIQIQVANAMCNQGVAYNKQGKPDEELNSYATLIEQFKESLNEEVQIPVAQAVFNQGVTYGEQGKHDDELNSYATLIEQYKDSLNEEIQILVANAMCNQGAAYGQQGKFEYAFNSFTTLIEQFKDSSNEEIQIQVAKAIFNQGVAYNQQGKLDDELNSYATLIEQFKDSSNEEIQTQVAIAVFNQGATYGQQGKLEDAFSSYATLIEQFKGSSNEEVQKSIANSTANIAELALLYETPEQVLNRVVEAEKYSDNPEHLAVMQFIRFLLDDKTIEEVLTALTAIPTELKLAWSFREIKDYLTYNFEGKKQQQIQAVVQYFEQHKDIEQLRVELGIVS
ncbi:MULTISPECIES: tetratricopeptide repeat protein [Pseudoalteromonas]|uniref:tetratricopeptide repeat protein n=1 Tax=Pseudoalteromonas TaxID=53246 RepID=UPI0015821412|nr:MULTISPECIES: tetratricopeptide repeat protein [Pseudoalteromonas]MDI4653945.1 tetratricopeptide repeat protein [Pseudoalteromonas shioyasakiensis]NUJ40223.1 hypothetical protein [Pseudoalteromonas sp. 0303]